MKKECIFACGGHGTRMGSDLPKQFLRINGKTILQLTLEKILLAVPDVRLIIALPEEYIPWWKEECARMRFGLEQTVVAGGVSRFHSVRNALAEAGDGSIVAVHDAVRPFVSADLVQRLFAGAAECGSAVPVTAVTDTLKALRPGNDGRLVRIDGVNADRSILFGAQTPQVFRSDILKDAYSRAYGSSYTDDASVVEAAGYEVRYVPGEKYNIKLTTPEDLSLAGRLLL